MWNVIDLENFIVNSIQFNMDVHYPYPQPSFCQLQQELFRPQCVSVNPECKKGNFFRFSLRTTPMSHQSFRITIQLIQLGTMQYHTNLMQHLIQCNDMQVYNAMHVRLQNGIFWLANGALKFFHYPTRYYSTTHIQVHYPNLPYPKLKNHYPSGPGGGQNMNTSSLLFLSFLLVSKT